MPSPSACGFLKLVYGPEDGQQLLRLMKNRSLQRAITLLPTADKDLISTQEHFT